MVCAGTARHGSRTGLLGELYVHRRPRHGVHSAVLARLGTRRHSVHWTHATAGTVWTAHEPQRQVGSRTHLKMRRHSSIDTCHSRTVLSMDADSRNCVVEG